MHMLLVLIFAFNLIDFIISCNNFIHYFYTSFIIILKQFQALDFYRFRITKHNYNKVTFSLKNEENVLYRLFDGSNMSAYFRAER